jgi:peptidoglycan/LPS O-acetylase OafA/YrhL
MDDLVLGTFLAIFEKKKLITSKSKKYFSFAFVVLLFLNLVPWFFAKHLSHFWLQIFKYPLISTLYFSLLGLLISPTINDIFKIFNFSWLRFSGKISYGLYVYHPLVFMLSEKYFQINNVFIEFACLVLMTVAVSMLSFYAYENQFLKLKKYFV